MTTAADLKRSALIAWMEARQGRFRYSNARPQKLNPDSSGETDCSGSIWRDYKDNGIDLADIDMSYELATAGVEVASGSTVAQFVAVKAKLKKADVVAMALKSGYKNGTQINHVELYDRDLYSWGHGGYPAMGPNRTLITKSWLLGDAAFWTVRRVIPDTATEAQEITTITNQGVEMFVIFQHGKSIGIWKPGELWYSFFPNPKTMDSVIQNLKVAKETVVYWGSIRPNRKKANDHTIEDLASLGENRKIWG